MGVNGVLTVLRIIFCCTSKRFIFLGLSGVKKWCGFKGKGKKAMNISIYCWLHKNVWKIPSYTGINKDFLPPGYKFIIELVRYYMAQRNW